MGVLTVVPLSLAAASCKPQVVPKTQTNASPAPASTVADADHAEPTIAAANGSTCPAVDFATFAEKFADSISLQARYTQWSLESTTIDVAATPEPKLVTTQTNEKDISCTFLMAFDRAIRDESP